MIFPLYIFDFTLETKPNEIPKSYTTDEIKNNLIPEIQPRDFNLLDKNNNYKISTLIIRKSGYLLKLYNFRCIVTSSKAYIFNTENFNLVNFIAFFNYSFNNSNMVSISLPYELRFLELILIYVCNQTDITIDQLTVLVNQISFEDLESSNLKNILSLQNKLTNAEQEYIEIKNVISELVESSEDMFDMFLSKKSVDNDNLIKDDELKLEEFERLLDNYNNQLNEDINLIKKLIKEIENKLRLADISLADFRNRIALYNTKISILSISISIGSFIAAIYGMNLKNHIENLEGGLYIISGIIMIISTITYNLIFHRLESIIKRII
jgi:magnesium transporter